MGMEMTFILLLAKLDNLEEGMLFSIGPHREGTFFYWSFQRGCLFHIGSSKKRALFYWLSQRRLLLLLLLLGGVPSSIMHKGTLCIGSGLKCRIPKMLGPCEGQPQNRGGRQWTYQL